MDNTPKIATGPLTFSNRLKRFVRHKLRKPYKKIRGSETLVSFLNQRNIRNFKAHPFELSALELRIVEDLREDGISITTLDSLLPEKTYQPHIESYALQLKMRSVPGRKKTFLQYLWGENIEVLDLENPFNALAIEPGVLGIVNAYMGLRSHFFFSSGNVTVPLSHDAQALGSQRWHRDPGSGDPRIVKIFLYINDVPTEAGPFEYVKQSHNEGRFGNIFPFVQPDGVYPSLGAVEEHAALKDRIVSGVGKAGTLIFCDTTGLHRGGYSRGKERIMATGAYTSPGSLQGFRYTLSPRALENALDLPLVSRYGLGLVK